MLLGPGKDAASLVCVPQPFPPPLGNAMCAHILHCQEEVTMRARRHVLHNGGASVPQAVLGHEGPHMLLLILIHNGATLHACMHLPVDPLQQGL